MENLNELLRGMLEKGHGVIVSVGTSAKNTCKEALDLAKTEDTLSNAIFNLGLAVFEEYNAKPKAAVSKLFVEEFAEISQLMETRDGLEESLKQRFSKPTCAGCGAKLNEKHTFCPECGTKVEKHEVEPEVKDFTCPECGEEYVEGQSYCGYCGYEL